MVSAFLGTADMAYGVRACCEELRLLISFCTAKVAGRCSLHHMIQAKLCGSKACILMLPAKGSALLAGAASVGRLRHSWKSCR